MNIRLIVVLVIVALYSFDFATSRVYESIVIELSLIPIILLIYLSPRFRKRWMENMSKK